MQKFNNVLFRFISHAAGLTVNARARYNHVTPRTIGAPSSSRLLSTLNVKNPYYDLERGIASSIQNEKKVQGYFALIVLNVRLTPRVLFLY